MPNRPCVSVFVCALRVEVSDAVENVDMSLEELQQLLLRSHQQSTVDAGTSSALDVSRPALITNKRTTCLTAHTFRHV